PNAATEANSIGTVRPCITCHNNPDGGQGCLDSGGTAPCLNPFGLAFRAAAFTWSESIASADADGDGFTNGQELQDPRGSWRPGESATGVPAGVTKPGFAASHPGLSDGDGDGYCWFGQDLNDDGQCSGETENNGAFDCNDSNAQV